MLSRLNSEGRVRRPEARGGRVVIGRNNPRGKRESAGERRERAGKRGQLEKDRETKRVEERVRGKQKSVNEVSISFFLLFCFLFFLICFPF